MRTDVPVNRYPNLTVIWNPLAVGVPDVRGNQYRDYFPGSRYVDAYGNNYYNTSGVYAFHRTEELYKAYPGEPFMFPEWGSSIDSPEYIRAFRDVPPQAQARPLRELLQRAGGRCVQPWHEAEEPGRLPPLHRAAVAMMGVCPRRSLRQS